MVISTCVWWYLLVYDDIYLCIVISTCVWWNLLIYCDIYLYIVISTYVWWCLLILWYLLTYGDVYSYIVISTYVWWCLLIYCDIYLRMVMSTHILWYLLTYGAYTADTMDSALVKGTGRLPAKHVTGKISLPSTKVQQCLLKWAGAVVQGLNPLHVIHLVSVPLNTLFMQPLGSMDFFQMLPH